ncbi:MAG: hypothetical protein CFH10_01662 [Alphaproteobacteria bacterium MarineAlpha4_Bin2]|nr:MAG: hypothetical protein CFH10_01662 [Alphaproteobacteria bacterium MarineAlpha4_Bin2]
MRSLTSALYHLYCHGHRSLNLTISYVIRMQFPNPVKGRAVWTAADLAMDSNWIHTLDPAECEEVTGAAKAVLAKGHDPESFDRADFPLRGLSAVLSALGEELHIGRGCVLIRGLPVEDYSDAEQRAAYWGIAAHFGDAVSQNAKGQRLAAVIDHGNDISRGNTRGYTTNAALYPHSDMCQMTGLLCVRPAASGGESQVASSLAIYNRIRETKPEYLEVLFRGFHHDLRGEGPRACIDEVTDHRVPVFSECEGWLSCGFNPKISINGEKKRGTPVSEADVKALDYVSEVASQPVLSYEMTLQAGDIQIVNNHAVLHSRNEFTDSDDPAKRRKLFRLWLNPHLQRPLQRDFANRYNTGPNGGVAIGDAAEYVF